MFATLVGTDTTGHLYLTLFEQLQLAAISKGFERPLQRIPARTEWNTERWQYESRGPSDLRADFALVVLAPKTVGISPLFPVRKHVDGPLFAVLVVGDKFTVLHEYFPNDASSTSDESKVMSAFDAFLNGLQEKAQRSPA